MVKDENIFGKGLTYCLGLFLAHAERFKELREVKDKRLSSGASMWFYGAADHIFGLETKNVPSGLKKRIKRFKHKVLSLRDCSLNIGDMITWKDVDESIEEAKELLLLIDKKNGIDVERAKFK